MGSKPMWNTQLPQIPPQYTWQIHTRPGGTEVQIFSVGKVVVQSFIDGQIHDTREVYLTKVWNAATRLANLVNDAQERRWWIDEVWDL